MLEEAGRIYVVARIDAHLVGNGGSYIGHYGVEVYIGHQRHLTARLTKSFLDEAQVLCFLGALRGEAHILAPCSYDALSLCDAALGIHGRGVGHALQADRVVTAQRRLPHMYLYGLATLIVE